MSRPKGLGRGLDALLGKDNEEEGVSSSLGVDVLQPGKYQPRTRMDSDSLEELAASIKVQGIMQPILVRAVGAGKYEIIAGERRWRAARIAGLTEVPVLIREIPDDAALAMSLIENIQRENLNPLEEAAGIQRLIDEFSMTHQEAADAVGRSRPAASNLLRLLSLAEPVQELILSGRIDMGHGRALLPLEKSEQILLANRVAAKGMSVRETERVVKRETGRQSQKEAPSTPETDRDLLRLQEELSDRLGAEVRILPTSRGGGTLSVRYSDLEQLDGILARFG